MSEIEVKKTQESLQDRLAQVVELLQRQRVVEDLTHRQVFLDPKLPSNGAIAHHAIQPAWTSIHSDSF